MTPRLRCAFCVCLLLLCGSAARAQIALYGNFEATNLNGAQFNANNTSSWVTGGTFGLYDDFYSFGPVKFGTDVRGSVLSSDSKSLNKILVGVRLAVKPPVLPIKPYVQLNGGVASLSQGSYKPGYKLAYEVNGGVDLTFLPHVDWRMVEVGGGEISDVAGSQFHVATGLVFRFF